MTREEYLNWCKNCVYRKPSRIGIVCSITNEYANFLKKCSNFSIDEKATRLNDEKYLSKKYSVYGSSIMNTEQKVLRYIWSQKNTPDRTFIKKYDKRKYYYFFILFALLPLSIGISELFFQKIVNTKEGYFLMTIGFLTIVILLFIIFKYKIDGKVILELYRDGLSYIGLHKFSWKEIQTFELQENGGRFICIRLLIKPLLKKEIVVDLTYLDSRPSKIIKLIEKYKEIT